MDGFEMRDVHRVLLVRSRTYLLHNLRPTETFWSTLMTKDVFPEEMIDEIKSFRLKSEQIGKMLDLLPARGPQAFDMFCETLLECDHAHVAEYMKTMEATDNFRVEVSRHCLVSDGMVENMVNIYKHSTPIIRRFAEQKYELLLEEQGRDLEEREKELRELENKLTILQLENSHLQGFISTCHSFSEDISNELQHDYIPKTFLRETSKYLETLKDQLKNVSSLEKICQFYSNMQALLAYIEGISSRKTVENVMNATGARSGRPTSALKRIGSAFDGNSRTLNSKMQQLVRILGTVIQTMGNRTYVTAALIRPDVEQVLNMFKEIVDDVLYVKEVFKTTLRQKRKLEGELVSLVHNWQEMRRLEREVKEKQGHISELNKESWVLKKKTRGQQHRKQLDHVHLNIEQKRVQLRELQKALERHLGSADVRLHSLIGLLPDLDENDYGRSDTDYMSDTTSRAASSLTIPSRKASHVKALDEMDNDQRIPIRVEVEKDSVEKKASHIIPQPTKVDSTNDTIKNSAANKSSDIPQPMKVDSTNDAIKTPSKDTANVNVPAARLLERRIQQQQRAAVRLSNPSKLRTGGYINRGQTNKPATMKYVPRNDNKVTTKEDDKNKPPEGTQNNLSTNQNLEQKPATTQQKEAKEAPPNPIDKWLANQQKQTKTNELHQKLANFNIIEAKDRTEEINKLGKTLNTPRKQPPVNDVVCEVNKTVDKPQVISVDKVENSGQTVNNQTVNKVAESVPSSASRSKSTDSEDKGSKGSSRLSHHVESPTRKISHSTTEHSSSRENSGGNDSPRKVKVSPEVIDRTRMSVSVMGGDLPGGMMTGRSTAILRQSLSSTMAETAEALAKRNASQVQRQSLSTNKVNLMLPGS